MIRLIVSEKPSMGRAIAAALGIQGSGRSFLQGEGLVVTWCVGHLVEAVGPESYDPALKQWRLDTVPFFPEHFRYAPIEATREQYDTVARLMNREDVGEVVNATDAGREGELIFDLVYRLSGCAKPVLRFWTSSLTDDAIRAAYGQMKPGEVYTGLRDAARSRQEADWLVGINCTRAQTLVMRRAGGDGVYSVGRVQTPTLALLVNRELEINNFVPKDFWTLWAVFQAEAGSYKGKWFRKVEGKDQDRFETEQAARDLAARLAGLPGKVASVTARTEKKKPELLYDLTALQKEANKRFGFTAEHTLDVAQDLYEAKLISYPRTNSRCLTEADAQKAAGWIKAIAQGQLAELQPFVEDLRKRWPVKLDKRFVNDKEVEDHSALVPTENPARNLQGDRLKIYELIARRFLAAHFPDRIEGKTTIITKIEKESFKTTGTVVKELGWSAVDPPHSRPKKESKPKEEGAEGEEPEEEEDTGTLPAVRKDEPVETRELQARSGKTTPPKRMSEADLLGAMQSAGKELDDEELKGAMKDCGLGTPATRANIIETLLKRSYAERKRNILQPTAKGIELIQSIQAETLKSPQMTGEWEARLERMRRGEAPRGEFMESIQAFVTELVSRIKQQAPQGAKRVFGPAVGTCPRCGASLHLRDWQGRNYVTCAGAECKVSFDTDPEGKPLETCRFCQGPVRTTRNGGKICLACERWQTEPDLAAPEPAPCPTCGKPMRVIPSTRRGQWFHRCMDCGTILPVGAKTP
ncbi:MAG TPA: DNA topoisomerase 3 [Holophaga sp.]|nr:DNA topoisomerase 3 [Holophaga sp.]HPS66422.1 DNA topoisomerase 3 [Holophaga sp.]